MIDLGSPQNIFCARHLEPLRADWPSGYAGLMMVLFQHAVRDEEILRACGWSPETGGQADITRLSAAIREFGPICCRIPEDEMEEWTTLALAPNLDEFIDRLKALEKTPPPGA